MLQSIQSRHRTCWILAFVSCVALGTLTANSDEVVVDHQPRLTVGSKAPDLGIEHWLSDGQSKFGQIKEFAPGKIYVVSFWATWSPHCLSNLVGLSRLQSQHQDVQMIAVSNERLDAVQELLNQKVNSDGIDPQVLRQFQTNEELSQQTYGQLAETFCLATDPDHSVFTDYMQAAAINRLPTTFVVGKEGFIEWIGGADLTSEVLTAIATGKWDRESFAQEFKKVQDYDAKTSELLSMIEEGDTQTATRLVDELIAVTVDPELLQRLKVTRVEVLMQEDPERALHEIAAMVAESKEELDALWPRLMKIQVLLRSETVDEGKLVSALEEVLYPIRSRPDVVLQVVMGFVQMVKLGDIESKPMMRIAAVETENAAKSLDGGAKVLALDASARLFAFSGDTARAIELEKQAIALAEEPAKTTLGIYLKSLEEATTLDQ